jgi:hypothetical protein
MGKPQKRMQLENDGELSELVGLDNMLDVRPDDEPIYCTRCGTPNPSDSRFCRKCGRSLAEQEAEMIGIPARDARNRASTAPDDHQKAKNARQRSQAEGGSARNPTGDGLRATLSIITMMCVAGMAITAFVTQGGLYAAASIPLFIAWFLIEGLRNAGRYRANLTPSMALISAFTTLAVTGMFITAIVVGGSTGAAITIPILIGWVLIEGIRGN